MRGRLTGKTAIVTGGGACIGKAVGERLAAEGANIVLADIPDGTCLAASLNRSGAKAISVRCDQSSAAEVDALRAETEKTFGGVDILVHNTGIHPFTLFEEMFFEEWRKGLPIDLDPLFHLVRAVIPPMKAKGWGRIITLSSATGHSGVAYNSHYMASKAGLLGFCRSLASEVGRYGITVNTVAPGPTKIDTDINGPRPQWFDTVVHRQAIKRTGTPADLVGPIAFLASEDAAFITGQTLVVDGGGGFA